MSESTAAVVGKSKEKVTVKELTTTAMMAAIVLLMAFTPLGYLRTGGLDISLLPIPVAIGAMVIGPKAGLILGTVFGLTSFYNGFGLSPFATTLMGINPIYTFFVCIPTRMLMGWLTGVLFKFYEKRDKKKTVCYFLGGITAPALNTVFFMSTLMLFFWNTEFIQTLNQGLGGLNVLMFVVAFIGINGLLEWPAGCIIGGIVSKTLRKVLHKKIRSN